MVTKYSIITFFFLLVLCVTIICSYYLFRMDGANRDAYQKSAFVRVTVHKFFAENKSKVLNGSENKIDPIMSVVCGIYVALLHLV